MDKLKQIRLKNGYSCKVMASELNISKAFYWQLENEKRKLSYESAFKIAKIFKLKPDELFYEEFDNKIS